MLHILFLCTGNTCRSPLAEAIMKAELERVSLPYAVSVSSAGLHAFPGASVSGEVIRLLEEEGLKDYLKERSLQLNRELIESADIVLVMTKDQLRELSVLFPNAAGKIYLLNAYAGFQDKGDINDPIGGGIENYRVVLKEIRMAIKKLVYKLKEE